MANGNQSARKKWTPVQHAVMFNAGAAYATATGDLLGGMDYVHSRSRDLSTDPIIQRAMAGTELYLSEVQKYQNALKEWENTENGEKGEKPQIEQSLELAKAQSHYEDVVHSSHIRTDKFHEFYAMQSIGEAKESAFYNGQLPKGFSDKAKDAIQKTPSDKKIKDIEADTPLAKTLDAIQTYYVLGKTAQGVAMNKLEKTVNRIHEQ
jgi:hypothetical protein